MKLTFVGSGSAFTVGDNNYQSNMLLENNEHQRLLIDCGGDVRLGLHELGFSAKDIQAVFISHLHADHTAGLEWLAFKTYFGKCPTKPVLYISEKLDEALWKNVLSGGLSSLENQQAGLSTYFKVRKASSTNVFKWSGIKFQLIPTLHSYCGNKINPSFGLFFRINNKNIFITADTQFTPKTLGKYYQKADIIFHDCETSHYPSGVHSHYTQLKDLEPSIKKKMWLYHYNPGKKPNAIKNGFCGFVKKGQCFDFS